MVDERNSFIREKSGLESLVKWASRSQKCTTMISQLLEKYYLGADNCERRVTPCCESGPMQWNWSWWARRGENTQILAGRPNSADFQSCCNTQWWARKINFPTEWQLAPWLSCVPWNFLPTPMSPRSFPQGRKSKTEWFPISTHTTPLPAPYKQT